VLIVDDEPLARGVIRDLVAAAGGLTVVGECRNGIEAVDAVRVLAPHLMFLDIQMPDLDGFGVLRALRPDRAPAVVLVTAYDEFAVQAFEAEALDFLVKPFTDDRFVRALNRARRRIGVQREMEDLGRGLAAALDRLTQGRAAGATAVHRSRFLVSSGRRSVSLPVESVTWIAADDYYARIYVEGVSYLLRESLVALERELDPSRFIRVHRSAIVNVGSVRELRREAGGKHAIVLTDGTRLLVSERRRGAVLRTLGGAATGSAATGGAPPPDASTARAPARPVGRPIG
jgi:two-component system, LytTR family, response regulator